MRYSVVTSGRALSDAEVDKLVDTMKQVHAKCPIKLCVSGGLLNEMQFKKLHEAGVERVHNNLESSRNHFLMFVQHINLMIKLMLLKRLKG